MTTKCNMCSWIEFWTKKEKEKILRQLAICEWRYEFIT